MSDKSSTLKRPSTPGSDQPVRTTSRSLKERMKTISSKDPVEAPKLPPMPDSKKLSSMFEKVLQEPDLKDSAKLILEESLTPEEKWAFIQVREAPALVSAIMRSDPSLACAKAFRLYLNTNPSSSWCKQFHEAKGLSSLVDALHRFETRMTERPDNVYKVENEILRAIKSAFRHKKVFMENFASKSKSLKKLVLTMDSRDRLVKERTFDLLALICLFTENGYMHLRPAMDYFCYKKNERVRFSYLIDTLRFEKNPDLIANALILVNCLINTVEDLDERMSIRYEMLEQGLEAIIQDLKEKAVSKEVIAQIEIFEADVQQDRAEFADRVGTTTENISDPKQLFMALLTHIKPAPHIFAPFYHVMQHLLELPTDAVTGLRTWYMLSRIVMQLSGRKDEVQFSVDKVIDLAELLAAADDKVELESLKEKHFELTQKYESELADLKAKLKHAQQPTQEREKLESQVRALSLEVASLKKELEALRSENESLKASVQTAQSPASATSVSSVDPAPQPPAPEATSGGPPPPPPPPIFADVPPPPPPMAPGAPPPPPPPGLGVPPPPPGLGKLPVAPKGPKPTVPLKGFQWTKLAGQNLAKSVFATLDPSDVLGDATNEIEALFAAKPTKSMSTDLKSTQTRQKEQLISHLEPKRQQNVGIFLQSFKNSISSIINAILQVDEELLTTEAIQRLCDNLPTQEEANAIRAYIENGGTPERLMIVDRFFWDLLQNIPGYDARLKAIAYKLSFQSKIQELRFGLLRVRKSARELDKNSKFIRLLEVILAVGNFLNHGTSRGNAYGFQLSSLLKLADTKTTDNKSNLLEFLIQFVEQKKTSISSWAADMSNVGLAARVNYQALAGDLHELKKGLADAKAAVASVEKASSNLDKFHDTIPPALAECEKQLQATEVLFTEVDNEYNQLVTKFGVQAQNTPPEEFFGLIYNFVQLWEKTKKELAVKAAKAAKEAQRKQDEIKRKAALEESRKQNTEQAKSDSQIEQSFEQAILAGRRSDRFKKNLFRRQETLRQKQAQKALSNPAK